MCKCVLCNFQCFQFSITSVTVLYLGDAFLGHSVTIITEMRGITLKKILNTSVVQKICNYCHQYTAICQKQHKIQT